jgi:hypothetical protein
VRAANLALFKAALTDLCRVVVWGLERGILRASRLRAMISVGIRLFANAIADACGGALGQSIHENRNDDGGGCVDAAGVDFCRG